MCNTLCYLNLILEYDTSDFFYANVLERRCSWYLNMPKYGTSYLAIQSCMYETNLHLNGIVNFELVQFIDDITEYLSFY